MMAVGLPPKSILNYIRNLCSLGFKLNNLVPLDKHNFALFCNFIQTYFLIGFDSPLHDMLLAVYQAKDTDEELITKAEEILGFGISWIKGLLDNPGIWISDMLFSDRDPE